MKSYKTTFWNRGPNMGWARVTSRREFTNHFGETFQSVDLNRRGCDGFSRYGTREVPWHGLTICAISWRAVPPKPVRSDESRQYLEKPSISFFERRQTETELRGWTVPELFERIDKS